jgi:tRNA-splicing ligase RtcB
MGRAEASRNLLVEDCDKAMEGVIFGRWGKDRKGRIDLGEAPGAYKDIESVIEAELDLVRPVVKLWPLGVVKG